ncbi:MAG: hypothetical protein ABIH23_35995 [bacterium]
MNYLALCKRLRLEIGWPGTGPAAVTGQTGDSNKIVEWIAAAYNDVQVAHVTWRFLRESFSFETIATVPEYTPVAAGLDDLSSWVEESFQLYSAVTDEQDLWYEPWNTFRPVYLFGSNRTHSQRPTIVTIKPNNSLRFFAIPDDAYTCTGEYYTIPDVMAANGDSPNFPDRFHMMCVWKGLMYYGAYAAADEKYAHGQNEYRRLMIDLELDQLDKILYGEPLA